MNEQRRSVSLMTFFPWWLWPSIAFAMIVTLSRHFPSDALNKPFKWEQGSGSELQWNWLSFSFFYIFIALLVGAIVSRRVSDRTKKERLVWPTVLSVGIILSLSPDAFMREKGLIIAAIAIVWRIILRRIYFAVYPPIT